MTKFRLKHNSRHVIKHVKMKLKALFHKKYIYINSITKQVRETRIVKKSISKAFLIYFSLKHLFKIQYINSMHKIHF